MTRRMATYTIAFNVAAASETPFQLRSSAQFLVARTSRLPAYDKAVEGLRESLSGLGAVTVVDLDQTNGKYHLATMLAQKPAIAVAMGSGAADALAAAENCAVIATMVLSPPAALAGRRNCSVLTLDVPPGAVLPRLKQLYPNRVRLAIVRGPAMTPAAASKLDTLARSFGYQPRVIECPGPKELLDGINSLQSQADFAWCFPDSKLYQGATVSAVLLAAIRNRLPVIGFSEGFVRAGALVGFYPDYYDIGKQAGETAAAFVKGQPLAPVEHPRKVQAAVNERVMRVLGIQQSTTEGTVIVK